MIDIRHGATALLLRTVNIVLSFFDRGIDGIVSSLSAAEAKLARYQASLDARILRESKLQSVSYSREMAVYEREAAARLESRARTQDALNDRARADRIRERINTLLG